MRLIFTLLRRKGVQELVGFHHVRLVVTRGFIDCLQILVSACFQGIPEHLEEEPLCCFSVLGVGETQTPVVLRAHDSTVRSHGFGFLQALAATSYSKVSLSQSGVLIPTAMLTAVAIPLVCYALRINIDI